MIVAQFCKYINSTVNGCIVCYELHLNKLLNRKEPSTLMNSGKNHFYYMIHKSPSFLEVRWVLQMLGLGWKLL